VPRERRVQDMENSPGGFPAASQTRIETVLLHYASKRGGLVLKNKFK